MTSLLLLASSVFAQRTPVRLALVGDTTVKEIVTVLDLATVKLGQQKNVELVDRDSIRRILEEQKLSLTGMVDADNVVHAGKLLGVDLFAVIDAAGRTNMVAAGPIGLLVFDARTGVRLADRPLTGDSVEALANAVFDGVMDAQRKHVNAKLPTVCLVSVRNADLPRSLDSFCDSVGLLLERRLMTSPDCAVLERQRLDQINRERELPGNDRQNQLLASLVVMQMECGRGPDGKGLRATAWLANNVGKELATFTVTNLDGSADGLVNALLEKIGRKLKLKGDAPKPEDRAAEADRFRSEAEFFLSHGDYDHGIPRLESAYALAPDARRLSQELAHSLIRYAGVQTNVLRGLRIADRGTELWVSYARDAYQHSKPHSYRGKYEFAFADFGWWEYLKGFDDHSIDSGDLSAAEKEEARRLLADNYTRLENLSREVQFPALSEGVLSHAGQLDQGRSLLNDYVNVVTEETVLNNLAILFPKEWSEHWLQHLQQYLNLIQQLPPESWSPTWTDDIRSKLNFMLFWTPTWRAVRPTERDLAQTLMESHPNPLVRA
ncbi:MAG TPA: hypothetical protein VN625_03135, partial [Desulfuromonadaceae bacterium]|nr:hypothetical protein [Desulfuromonadaceae bacterium]